MYMNVVIDILKYIHPVEAVMVVVLFILCLIATILIVKDVIKEAIHPSKTTDVIEDEIE